LQQQFVATEVTAAAAALTTRIASLETARRRHPKLKPCVHYISYWEPLPKDEQTRFLEKHPDRRPYRIELVRQRFSL
jgi:hypothetical protein